jgi:hypothetical protein
MICPITFLNLEHLIDRDGLKEDMNNVTFTPFSDSSIKEGFFKHAPHWEQAKVDDTYEMPFVSKINELIKGKAKFYKQHAYHSVPPHTDIDTLCCINILISEDNAPVNFEDWGDFTYHCALLDVTQRHSIISWQEERHVLKFSIFDRTYNQALEEFKDYISPEQGPIQYKKNIKKTSKNA